MPGGEVGGEAFGAGGFLASLRNDKKGEAGISPRVGRNDGRGYSLMSSRTRNVVEWRDLPASGKGQGMKAFPLGVSRA